MFTTLAKSGLANFRLVQLRRIAPGPHQAAFSDHPHLNDNLPGFRRPAAAGKRRPPTPALACHWVDRDGRLECCWHFETDATPGGGLDAPRHSAPDSACGRSTPRSRNLALTG
jgi:hypothetical protein